ncbi:MAG: glycosyltransferase [Elusimicrobiota bacterium]|jgi:glycosyltransferase involved in cell wall biosynthesis|nr:glycosyltransferase [Elusimicrobiota bacterium]
MDRTKIAFIITRLELGGAQKSVLYSARNIDKTRFESYLLTGAGGYFDTYAQENIENVFFIPALQRTINPFKDLSAFAQIILALVKIKPQIVHTNSSKAGILGRAAAYFYKRRSPWSLIKKYPKIVHTVHGFGFNDRQNFLTRTFYILLEQFFADKSDVLVFVSIADLQTAIKLKIAPAEKCRLIRAGIELKTKSDFKNFDRTAKLAALGLPAESKIILCPANLKPQKNPLDMVRAAKIVCAQMPEAVFLFLGTGPLKKETETLIKDFGLQNNFKLLGHRNDVAQLLAIADVFALSSLWEGLPMALIEAISMQVPAVCYDAGGIAEVLHNGQNGALVQTGDYKGLAGGILNILYVNFTFDFPTAALKEFDIKAMLKQQQQLYADLLTEK